MWATFGRLIGECMAPWFPVANKLEVSIYDSVIRRRKLPFLPVITNAKTVNAYGVCGRFYASRSDLEFLLDISVNL